MNYPYYPVEPIKDLRELLEYAQKQYGHRVLFKEYDQDHTLQIISYKGLIQDVQALGTALIARGITRRHIGIIGDNSSAWVKAYLCVINGLGVAVPLDKELSEEQLMDLLIKGDCEMIFTSEKFYQRICKIQSHCPLLKEIVLLDPCPGKEYGSAWLLPELLDQGRRLLFLGDKKYRENPFDVEACCEILFTSGTTGANKGVMLSQKNLVTVARGAAAIIRPPGETISLLPIHHSYECSCHILAGILLGATTVFNDSLKNVIQNFRTFKPAFTLMVPMFLESFSRHIWKDAEKNHLKAHLQYGVKFSRVIRKIGIDRRRYFFKPIIEAFGGNLRQIVCGGAPLSDELMQQFIDFGIEVVNGYGITECGPLVSCSSFAWKTKTGNVGRPIMGCHVRISDEEEIQISGDNVMLGYYKDEEATRQTFTDDGWLRTGDLGFLDHDGFLHITGRLKNLIILGNGKNVHPESLEEMLGRKLAYVKESIIYADQDEGIKAACYLDPEWCLEQTLEAIYHRLKEDLKQLNRLLPSYMQIKDVSIVDHEFEKTTTKKIKRYLFQGGQK